MLTSIGARVLFAIPFAVFGFFHFPNAQQMVGMVPSWVPGGVIWVYFTGVAMILACISIITKKQGRLASLLLALLMIIFALTVHLPNLSNPDMMQMAMVSMLKDLALAGGALGFAGQFEAEESL